MAVSGIVYGWSGLDRHSGLLQRRGADDVPFVDAGARSLHVPARVAGRHGAGQRDLGRTGVKTGRSGSIGVVGSGDDRRVILDPQTQAYRGTTANGSSGRARLKNSEGS